MLTEILMPQLGESVVEGTVSRWLIGEGQRVEQDQPLLQITTDKVDTELPAPASGILLKILVPEGETVAKGTVLAVIGDRGPGIRDQGSGTRDQGAERVDTRTLGFISPVVARLAEELHVDLTQISGTGAGGRITKKDVLAYATASISLETLVTPETVLPVTESLVPDHPAVTDDEIVPLSAIRRSIARHMVLSKQTAPHATTVMEADMTSVVRRASGCGASSSDRVCGSPLRRSFSRRSRQGSGLCLRPTAASAKTRCLSTGACTSAWPWRFPMG